MVKRLYLLSNSLSVRDEYGAGQRPYRGCPSFRSAILLHGGEASAESVSISALHRGLKAYGRLVLTDGEKTWRTQNKDKAVPADVSENAASSTKRLPSDWPCEIASRKSGQDFPFQLYNSSPA